MNYAYRSFIINIFHVLDRTGEKHSLTNIIFFTLCII